MAGDSEPGPRALWKRRYSSRARTLRQQHARQYVDGGLVVFDPAGPYPGVDGSTYHPGGLDEDKGFPGVLPVVLVASRGMAEMLVGWANWREMLRWVAGRGTTGTGELEVPPAAASARCVREDAVLAYALRGRAAAAAITQYLPHDTFTSDVRFEVFAAIADVMHSGLNVTTDRVAAALHEREALIPPRQRQEHYGGAGLPWAQAYLRRLDQSWVNVADARSAAASLRSEDRQAVAVAARQAAAAQATAGQRAVARPKRRTLAGAQRAEAPALQAPRLDRGRDRALERPPLDSRLPGATQQP